jgi:flagellar hook protein FlgE
MALGSFAAGLSGLAANQVYLNVIGNNLANVNTIGFKSSAAAFMDLVSQSVGGAGANPSQVGLGVVTSTISPVFTQGSIENTGDPTNVAIQGNGFFVVKSPSGGQSYTRAGNFSVNEAGDLVTPEGYKVQGYTTINPATGAIVTTGQPTSISIPPGVLRAPTPTTQFRTVSNLDSNAAVNATFTTAVEVMDSLGSAHLVTVTYTKTGPGAWSFAVTAPGAEVTGGVAGTPFALANGTMTFTAAGKLATVNGAAPADVAINTPTWTNGAAANALSWDLMDASGNASLTGFAAPSATTLISQNGAPPGVIDHVTVSADGTIQATLGPGLTVPVAQIVLANFNNPKGLVKLGSNRYGESQASGIANVGVAGTGGRGVIFGGALEQSNVDIAQEFTKMILAQRGYQANSKTITVSDELLLETLNLKR